MTDNTKPLPCPACGQEMFVLPFPLMGDDRFVTHNEDEPTNCALWVIDHELEVSVWNALVLRIKANVGEDMVNNIRARYNRAKIAKRDHYTLEDAIMNALKEYESAADAAEKEVKQ